MDKSPTALRNSAKAHFFKFLVRKLIADNQMHCYSSNRYGRLHGIWYTVHCPWANRVDVSVKTKPHWRKTCLWRRILLPCSSHLHVEYLPPTLRSTKISIADFCGHCRAPRASLPAGRLYRFSHGIWHRETAIKQQDNQNRKIKTTRNINEKNVN